MRRIKTFPVTFHDGPHVTLRQRDFRLMRAAVRALDRLANGPEGDADANTVAACDAIDAFNAQRKRKP